MLKKQKGFTLIELLIVIAIIAIIASVVFVALDPLSRFQDSRDASRWADISALISAIKIDQVDNGGAYASAITAMVAGQTYMITTGGVSTDSCDTAVCAATVSSDAHCVDLLAGADDLVTEGYVGSIPISPAGVTTWDEGDADGENGTGYTIRKDTTGIITITACEGEGGSTISIAR